MIYFMVLLSAISLLSGDPYPFYFKNDVMDGTGRIINQPSGQSLSKSDYDVAIIGAGITGLAAAVALKRLVPDLRICVCEKSTNFRPVGALVGLFPNGMTALAGICPDLVQNIRKDASAYLGTIQSDSNGNVVRENLQQRSPNGPLMYVWFLLQKHLASSLRSSSPNQSVIHLGKFFEKFEINRQTNLVKVIVRDTRDRCELKENHPSQSISSFTCRVLIGADGLHSKVRSQLLKKKGISSVERFASYNRVMYRAAVDIHHIPRNIRPAKRGVSYTYRCGEVGKVFAFHESVNGILTFTATIIPDQIPESVEINHNHSSSNTTSTNRLFENSKRRLQHYFSTYPSTVKSIIEYTNASSIHENMVYDIDVPKKWSDGPVVIIGDAAHAMTPSLGQGGNVGLEDSCELAHVLAPIMMNKNYSCISSVLEDFWRERFPRVKEIHDKSRQQAIARNKNNDAASTFRQRNGDFYARLYNWKPTFRSKLSTNSSM